MAKPTYYITTPIYYPSDNFHIGHCYTTVTADALARYKKLKGFDVYFLTGSDEHGSKIEERAKAKGLKPIEFVNPIIDNAKDLWKSLNIEYDRFIRTTDEDHVKTVQKIFEKLYKQDDIYKGSYEGWYCTSCEAFFTETQLKDHKCPDCGKEVKLTKEDAYFFKLSKYQKEFEKYLNSHRELMQPESRYNEMYNNFLKPGLKDLCVSRSSVKWGIPVTFDTNQTIYVWVDALSNYITALGYDSENDSLYQKYWPADLHLVGKEIFRFHTIIWPIMLLALKLPLPKKVYGHGWLTIDGDKISKSKNNFKDPRIFVKDYGVDTIRYFLLSEVPFGSDGNFSEVLMVERRNSDLCNVLGNLVSRTITMSNKYFKGNISTIKNKENIDKEVIELLNSMDKDVEQDIDKLNIPSALANIFRRLERLNKYIDETQPWALAKDPANKQRLNDVLYVILEGIRMCSLELEAFIPSTSKKIYNKLKIKTSFENFVFGSIKEYFVSSDSDILFERIDIEALKKKLEEDEPAASEAETKKEDNNSSQVLSHKPEVEFSTFENLEMVVGEVKACRKHENADKILVFDVDFGGETRQILSAIAKYYKPDELVGKKVVAVLNFKPRTIRGLESNGMLLSFLEKKDGKETLRLVTSDMPIGSIVC